MTLILMFTHLICVSQHSKIENFKITILSTMLSDTHVGEWGFSALIEADGQKVLFDTGSREKTVIQNANELNILAEKEMLDFIRDEIYNEFVNQILTEVNLIEV